jgi:hypothetical protein
LRGEGSFAAWASTCKSHVYNDLTELRARIQAIQLRRLTMEPMRNDAQPSLINDPRVSGSATLVGHQACSLRRPSGRQERRQRARRELACKVILLDDVMCDQTRDPSTIPGECLNVCDGGLYATVPLGYGVTIGQRYTFRLMVPERGPEPGPVQIVSQQGMIIRTELLVDPDDGNDRLGIAIKLTGHRSGVVPMPG